MKKNYLFVLVIMFALFACTSQSIKDDDIIKDYISQNNIPAVRHSSGIYYLITDTLDTIQTTHPTLNSNVTVKYKGYFIDGTVFDQTTDNKTVTFNLGQVIPGWQYGVQLMKKGDKEILLVPSSLGYGNKDYRSIPANSVLIFELELVDFK